MSDPSDTKEILNPVDLQKSAKLLGGASASEVRAAMKAFNATNAFPSEPPLFQAAQESPLIDPVVPRTFSDTFSLSGASLDPGVSTQLPVVANGNDGGGGTTPVDVVVTGILNGVAASGTALFTGTPTPL
jgi:hypothetical protein